MLCVFDNFILINILSVHFTPNACVLLPHFLPLIFNCYYCDISIITFLLLSSFPLLSQNFLIGIKFRVFKDYFVTFNYTSGVYRARTRKAWKTSFMTDPCVRNANNKHTIITVLAVRIHRLRIPLARPLGILDKMRKERCTPPFRCRPCKGARVVLSLSIFETQRVKFILTRTDIRHLPSLCAYGLAETELSFAINQWCRLVTRDPTWWANDPPQTVYSVASLRHKTETDAEPLRILLYFGDSRRRSIAVER